MSSVWLRRSWRDPGRIQAISSVGLGSAGEGIYQVKAENGLAEVRLDPLKEGRVATIALGPE
jgi:hypothetical protein